MPAPINQENGAMSLNHGTSAMISAMIDAGAKA